MKTAKTITESIGSTAVLDAPVAKRKVGRPVTKVTLRRVVLANGKPVGRGRPTTADSADRTVVFVPVGEKYNASIHGVGSKYIAGLSQFSTPIKRVDIAKFQKLVAGK